MRALTVSVSPSPLPLPLSPLWLSPVQSLARALSDVSTLERLSVECAAALQTFRTVDAIAPRVADVPSLVAVLRRAQCVRADVSALNAQCRSERSDVAWRVTPALSLSLQWRLERTIVSAFAIHSARAILTANDTERIIDVDERGQNIVDTADVDTALKMIRREIGVDDDVSDRRFVWFVSALVTFPSDEAFDVVSAALMRD